jgi:NifU-like N terminal domain
MKLQIRVNEDGVISDVKFKTFGCGSAIASSSYMTERVKGLSLEEAGKIKNTEIAKELCLPPVKLHCSSKSFLLSCVSTVSLNPYIFQCWLRMLFALRFEITRKNVMGWPTPNNQGILTSLKAQ